MRTPALILILCSWYSALWAQPPIPATVRGVKVYEPQKDRTATFRAWKALGLNTIWIGGDLAKDPTFFRDAQAEQFKTQVVFPVFYNPEALASDPGLWAIQGNGQRAKDDWVEFVCPSRPAYRQERVKEVRRILRELKPDGISFDFIRHFVFWEMKYPDAHLDPLATTCFCEHCLTAFQQAKAVTLPRGLQGTPAKAAWILQKARGPWLDWRCAQITTMVAELSRAARAEKPDVWLNLHIVPFRRTDFDDAWRRVVGQDLAALGPWVDTLSPMVYAPMVKQTPHWIHAVTREVAEAGGKPVLPSIQVKECYLPEVITPARFKADLEAALEAPSRGVVFWNWDGLAESPEKRTLAVVPTAR